MNRTLIIGTGLMGTSIGLALSRVGAPVLLDDPNADHLADAVAKGAGQTLSASDSVDVVIVATPPRVAGAAMAAASRRFTDAVITDIASVKTRVLRDAREAGAQMSHLVGGHPMAGRETAGPSGARADLLDGRLWVITPESESTLDSVRAVHELALACGAIPVEMTASEHDAAVALVSHLPQLVATSIASELNDAPAEHVRIAGQGLVDMTRIAGSNPVMWSDIVAGNAHEVGARLDALITRLATMRDAVQRLQQQPSDPQAIADLEHALTSGGKGRALLPGKHGSAPSSTVEVPVLIADTPGSLAALVVAAGELNVNLEDIRIEHVFGKPSGMVSLFIRPTNLDDLVLGLRERGFDVRS